MWVLVTEKIATLQEIDTCWSLDDLMRAHAIISYRAELNNLHRKKAEMQSRIKSKTRSNQ